MAAVVVAGLVAQRRRRNAAVAGGEVPILVDDRTGDARQRGTLRLADGAIASVVLGDLAWGLGSQLKAEHP